MRRAFLITATVVVLTAVVEVAVLEAKRTGVREQVIRVTAKKFEYSPSQITVKKGVPIVLELTSLDRHHGFKLPDFSVRADIEPGEVTRVRIVPRKTGHFPFECDVFCGSGHEDMGGEIVVVD